MTIKHVLSVFVWSVAAGFLADLARRCWIVQAGTIFPPTVIALAYCAHRLRKAWKAARRVSRTDFVRINPTNR